MAANKEDAGWSVWDLVPDLGSAKDGAAKSVVEYGTRAADNAKKIITDGALGDYPGYGSLWTYDKGVHVQTKGWAVLGAAAVAVYLVMKA